MAKRQFRWFIITIPTSYLVIGIAAIVAAFGLILALIYGTGYLDTQNKLKAESLIEQAEILIQQAEKERLPANEVNPSRTLVAKANNYLSVSDFKSARRNAEDAVSQLEYLLASYKSEGARIKGRYAVIKEIRGVVEVLKPGKADWETAVIDLVVQSGTRIRTQRASTAKLKFDDNSIIHMKAESLIMIRTLAEDEITQAKRSNIELGVSEIEAQISQPRVMGSQFLITMPDESQAMVEEESTLSISVNESEQSVVKVFMGQVDILSGDRQLALTSRQAVVLDPREAASKKSLTALSIPMPPRLIYPANVQLLSIMNETDEILFRWTRIDQATSYKIELAMDYYFYDLVKEKVIDDNRVTLSGLSAGNYYWRVSSINETDLSSEPSPFNSFRLAFIEDLKADQKDLTPPTIKIDIVNLLGHIVDIQGKTEPNVSLYVNEQKEDVFEDGSFRVLVEFDEPGQQEIFIEAYDSAGNVSTVRRDVVISDTAVSR